MTIMKYHLKSILFTLGIALFLSGCAVNPVTGDRQLMLLSEQDESQLGRQTDQSVVEQYGVYDDKEIQSYVYNLGMPMARASHRPNLDWNFKVMDSPVVNAFAAPGGYVYVTRGLMAAANNEAELAGILGHEIGHVTARHSAKQYSNKVLTSIGLEIGKALAGSYGDALGPVLDTGAGLIFLKFSRDDEYEADTIGVEYASRGNFDASRMADFFTTLDRMRALDGNGGGQMPEWFSTHPNPLNRQASVRDQSQQWQAKLPGQTFRVNRDRYLEMIDGMAFGENPQKGFYEEGWYYLPLDALKFQVPTDWKVDRDGRNVQLAHPDGKGAVFFAEAEETSLDKAVDNFIKKTKVKFNQHESGNLHGMPYRRLVSTLSGGGKTLGIVSRFYQKNGRIFAFHGLTSQQNFEALSSSLEQPAKSFGSLTERSKLNKQPKQIRIKLVPREMSLQQVFAHYRVDEDLWEKTAWLNGRQLSEILPVGYKIKIVK